MLDISYIRENPEKVRENMQKRGIGSEKLDGLLRVDEERVGLIKKRDEINTQRNENAKRLSDLRGADKELVEKGKRLKEELEKVSSALVDLDREFNELILWIPNMLSDDVPLGEGENDNIEITAWIPKEGYLSKEKLGKGEFSSEFMPKFPVHSVNKNFKMRDHIDLGEINDIIDIKQSALVSGSRFAYIKNEAVILQMGLVHLLSKELLKRGFFPINPPLLVKERALIGTSHFPADKDQVYSIKNEIVEEKNELYLVGSSEPSNFAYFMDKTLNQKDFPQKMFATTTCFRSEVGSWGKDVKGIKRVHQFDKLEMDVVCLPSQSGEVFDELLDINKWFWEILEIPYHIIFKCSKDSGYYASAKQYDIEAWLPSQGRYIEVGTDTNAADYQARRMNIKYKGNDGKTHYVHTVNDTGCPLGRALIAIMDNYQQEDGSISVPAILQDYVGFDKIYKDR